MFQFLQRNSTINYLLVPIVIILLWASNILNPTFIVHNYDANPMFLYKPFMGIQNWSPFAGQILAIILVIINALLLVRVNTTARLFEKRSIFYVFLFVLLSACVPDFKQLNPMQFAMIFLILGLSSLFKMYKNERELKTIFESAALFSIASLFYAPAICYILILFIGLLLLVPFYWRQWIAACIGIVLPYIFVFSIGYCTDSLMTELSIWKDNLIPQNTKPFTSFIQICFSGYLGVLFLLSAAYTFTGGVKKIALKKYYLILLLALLLSLGLYIALPFIGFEILYFGLLPAIIFISNYMMELRRKVPAELLFLGIVVFVLLSQIFPDLTVI